MHPLHPFRFSLKMTTCANMSWLKCGAAHTSPLSLQPPCSLTLPVVVGDFPSCHKDMAWCLEVCRPHIFEKPVTKQVCVQVWIVFAYLFIILLAVRRRLHPQDLVSQPKNSALLLTLCLEIWFNCFVLGVAGGGKWFGIVGCSAGSTGERTSHKFPWHCANYIFSCSPCPSISHLLAHSRWLTYSFYCFLACLLGHRPPGSWSITK